MRVGVGLPATVPGADARLVVEWARRADSGPFASLGVLDRVLYDNYEPLTALAAAAAVTERIALAATVVIAPLRGAAVLAKQAASVQALSGGRLVLGVGLGARQDDYDLAGVPYRTRGKQLTEVLAQLGELWDDRRFGPHASHPPTLLVGGGGGLAAMRTARFAEGYVHNGGPPRAFSRAANEALAAWEDAGRPGGPQLWGMAYYTLCGQEDRGMDYLRDYYAFTGPFADKIAAGLLTTREALSEFCDGYREAGCTHLILFPSVADLRELDALADALSG